MFAAVYVRSSRDGYIDKWMGEKNFVNHRSRIRRADRLYTLREREKKIEEGSFFLDELSQRCGNAELYIFVRELFCNIEISLISFRSLFVMYVVHTRGFIGERPGCEGIS